MQPSAQPTARTFVPSKKPLTLPNKVPTTRTKQPSGRPTTIIPEGLSYLALTFASVITMSGLDSSLMSTKEAQLAIRTSIAGPMIGVRPRDVLIVSALKKDVRRGLNEHNDVDRYDNGSEIFRPIHLARTLVAGTAITWNVSVSLSRLGDTTGDGEFSFSVLSAALKDAVAAGSFLSSVKKLSTSFSSVTTLKLTMTSMWC